MINGRRQRLLSVNESLEYLHRISPALTTPELEARVVRAAQYVAPQNQISG